MLRRLPASCPRSLGALFCCVLPAFAASSPPRDEPPLVADHFEVQDILTPALGLAADVMAFGANDELWLAGRNNSQDPSRPFSVGRSSDANGDGRLDRVHIFHDFEHPVSALLALPSGVLAASAAQVHWLRDSSGDGRADRIEVLYAGLGNGPPAAGLRDFHLGLDGWVWAVQGANGARSIRVHSPHRDREQAHAGQAALSNFGELPPGLIRLRLDGSSIEPLAVLDGVIGGLAISRRGEVFFSRRGPSSLAHLLLTEEALGARRVGGARTWSVVPTERRRDHGAVAGVVLHQGGVWPAAFDGGAFVCLPQAGRVDHYKLERTPDSFRAARVRTPLLRAADSPFTPQQICNGPGGALYVLDHPTEDMHAGGRTAHIWRVQYVSPGEMRAENSFQQALRADCRLLASAEPAAGYIDNSSPESSIRTLWRAFRAMHSESDPVRVGMAVEIALASENSALRRNAARIAGLLGRDPNAHGTLAYLVRAAADPDQRVRLAALRALREFKLDASSRERLLAQMPRVSSPEVLSLWLAIAHKEPTEFFALALAQLTRDPARPVGHDTVLLLESLARDPRLAASAPGARDLHESVHALAKSGPAARCALHGVRLFWNADLDSAAGQAVLSIARDAGSPPELRLAALHGLLLDPSQTANAMSVASTLLQPAQTASVQAGVLGDLVESQAPGSGELLARALSSLTPDLRQRFARLLEQRGALSVEQRRCFEALFELLDTGQLHPADLPPGLRNVLRNAADEALAKRARKLLLANSTTDADAWIEANATALAAPADARNGARVFHVNCAPCHRVQRGGGLPIGPDVANFEPSSPTGLLQRILQPQREIEGEYLEYIVSPRLGREVHGRISHEDQDSITITGIAGVRRLARAELRSLRSTGKSPMPSGFEALGPAALRDLLAYLREQP